MYPDNFLSQSYFDLNTTKAEEGCKLCFQQDCMNGGKCENPYEQYSCRCPKGFEKEDCSQNIDECQTEKAECKNNSTCEDGIGTYYCKCQPGYQGTLCEFEINECLSEPCHNGGTCTDQLAGYTCECSDEYTGPQCNVLRLVTCDNKPCKVGSQCLNGYSKS